MPRRIHDEVGSLDEELVRSQDYEMLLRIARRYPGLMLPEVVFLHREHSGVRGTAAVSFSASENADRWAKFNRDIFTRLLDSLADHELLASSDLAALPEAQRPRACRIKRGCVLARQRMWTEAVKAWRQAAAMDASPLSWLERDILARSPNSALGAPELFDNPEVRSGFADLSRQPLPGPQIADVVRRAARWHIRAALQARDLRRVMQGVRFMLAR